MFNFNAFVTTANKYGTVENAANAQDVEIVLNDKIEGQLGMHKVVVKEPTKEELQLIQKTKDELTQSLCNRFGVKDRTMIPKDVLTMLNLVNKSKNILASDIIKLNEEVERYEKQEKFLNEEFAKAVEEGNNLIGELLVKCGCSKYFGLPKGCPLEQALNALVDKMKSTWLEPGTSTTALENHGKNIVNILKDDINNLLTQAFGENLNGPLALKLNEIVNATGKSDLFPKLVDAINGYFLPGQKVAQPKANSEVVAPNVPPAGDVDLNSSKDVDLTAEYDRLMDDFAKRLEKFVGNDAKHILGAGSPLGKELRKVADDLVNGDKSLTATVGKLREKMTETFERRLGTEGFPSELAKSMQLSYLDPDISAGDRRLLYALALSTAVHKGVPNADNLVKRDYLAAAVVETKGENPLASRQIEWFLANKADDTDLLKTIADSVDDEDFGKIEELAEQHGCPNLSDEAIDRFIGDRSVNDIMDAIRKHAPGLLDKPGVRLYVQQHAGLAPVDYQEMNSVCRPGGWMKNRELGEQIFKCLQDTKPSPPHDLQEKGEGKIYLPRYDQTIEDLRAALNPKKGGGFKTAPAKTKGQLSVDGSGNLHSHNRHFGSTVPMTEHNNLTFKLSIVNTFRRNVKSNQKFLDSDFLKDVRQLLELDTLNQGKPVSRAAMKTIFLMYDELNSPKIVAPKSVPLEDIDVENAEVKVDVQNPKPIKAPSVDMPRAKDLNNAWQEPFAIMKRLLKLPGIEKTSFAAFGPDDAPIELILKTKDLTCPNANQGADFYDGSLYKAFPAIYSKTVCEAVNKIKGDNRLTLEDVSSALLVAKLFTTQIADPDERFTSFATEFAKKIGGDSNARPSADEIATAKLVLMQGLVKIRFSEAEQSDFDRIVMAHSTETMKTESWSFNVGGKSYYTSSFTPCAEIGKANKVETGDRTSHLSGFLSSRLLDNAGKPIVTCLRFGEFSCHGAEKKECEALYSELIEQAFLNNPDLVDVASGLDDGQPIEMPLMRLDLDGYQKLDEPPKKVKLTFTRPGDDLPHTVTIMPKVEHFCLPIGSLGDPNKGNLMTTDEVKRNLAAWASLKTRASAYDGANKALVGKLVGQIDTYMTQLFGGKTDPVKTFPGSGAELTRLAGRLGALDALIGGVPAVNGYAGRDRTGVVDNEIKMLMVNLRDSKYVLPEIRQAGGVEDPDAQLRTQMLVGTGNNAIGHQITLSSSPINLDAHENSGLAGLFKADQLNPTQLDNVSFVPKTENEVAKELLSKELQNVGKVTVIDVPRDGSCFFHAIELQMTEEEKQDFGDFKKLRERMISEADKLRQEIDSAQNMKLGGSYKSEDMYFFKNSHGDNAIGDAFNRAAEEGFKKTTTFADMGQAAFIATMLKRPVYVVSQDWKDGMKNGDPSVQAYDRDLRSGNAFDDNAKPIYIYYDRTNNNSGHFRAIEVTNG